MFKLYKFLIEVIILLALIAGGAYYAWMKGWIGSKGELQIDKTENVVTSVKQIAEFVSMHYYEEFTLSTSKRMDAASNKVANAIVGLLGNTADEMTKDQLVIIAKGHIRAGFNLANVKDDDVSINGDTLHIKLPKAEILDATVNPSDFEVFIENGTWSHEQVQKLEDKAIAEIKARAIKAGVLEKAKENGVTELTNMYKAFGFKEVVCEVTQ